MHEHVVQQEQRYVFLGRQDPNWSVPSSTVLAVSLGFASLHHLTAVDNTDSQCNAATLDDFASGASRHSWEDLFSSSLLGWNLPEHGLVYTD